MYIHICMHIATIIEKWDHVFEREQVGVYERAWKKQLMVELCNFIIISKIKSNKLSVVIHDFNPSKQKIEAGGSLVSLRLASSTKKVPGQSGLLHRVILSWKTGR